MIKTFSGTALCASEMVLRGAGGPAARIPVVSSEQAGGDMATSGLEVIHRKFARLYGATRSPQRKLPRREACIRVRIHSGPSSETHCMLAQSMAECGGSSWFSHPSTRFRGSL